jgi:DNA-binding LacI/PurR family transcriptional regulator
VATLFDVAKAAAVAIQTVSLVINDKPGISEPTRVRVLQAVRELDYHPNNLGKSLRSRRTYTIGVLIPSVTNPYFSEIVRGIEDAAHRAGYSVFLCNTDGEPEKLSLYLEILHRHRVAGLICTMPPNGNQVVEDLVAHGTPVVLLGGGMAQTDARIVIVTADERQGERTATAHLLGLGHRRIGLITGPAGLAVTTARVYGYEDAFLDFALEPDPELVVPGGFNVADGEEGAAQLLRLAQPPTAIIAANDLVAIGAIMALKRGGQRVPEDVSVIGYDDIGLAAIYDPALTTIAQPLYAMGVSALQATLDRVGSPALPGEIIRFETQLVVRDSVLPFPTPRPRRGNRQRMAPSERP